VGLLENVDYVALDVAIAMYVRGLQTRPILVENQPFRICQIIGPDVGPAMGAIAPATGPL
jgi:hypothetical protein